MTQTLNGAGGLVRVTVVAGERKEDLALPGSLPVAELLPELVRLVGLLDAQTAHAGYSLVSPDGRRLTGDRGLTLQGVDSYWQQVIKGLVLLAAVAFDIWNKRRATT